MQLPKKSREPEQKFENGDGSVIYERGKMLGEGSYGRVYTCRDIPKTTKLCAVKIVDAKELITLGCAEREMKRLRREAVNMEKVSGHPNILRFEECFGQDDDWMYFLTELVFDFDKDKSVSLLAHMCRDDPEGKLAKPFKDNEARRIVVQIVAGVKHLHAASIIHRDLKLDNILVEVVKSNFKVKIIDFGLSKELGDGLSKATTMAGTPPYMSPEMVQGGDAHDHRTDLWSLGILIFVMLFAYFPKKANGRQQEQDQVDAEISELKDVSTEARSVLLRLLKIEPTKRISLDVLANDAWLKEIPEEGGCQIA